MPLEVFQIWIVPEVKHHRWKGVSVNEPLQEGWKGFFAGYAISFWKSARWQLCSTPFDTSRFAVMSVQRALWIVDHATIGIAAEGSDGPCPTGTWQTV